MRIVVDGRPIEFEAGDSVATAIVRAGQHPGQGGCLCFGGDCGNCVAVVDGIAFVRTCQTPARPGTVVARHPVQGAPSMLGAHADGPVGVRREHVDVVVVGAGASGTAATDELRRAGRDVVVLDAREGDEVVAVYAGPLVVVRGRAGMRHIHADEVVIATGAAELHPVCPGSNRRGIYTPRAFQSLRSSGVALGRVVSVGGAIDGVDVALAGTLERFDGDDEEGGPGRVTAVVTSSRGEELSTPCDAVVVALGGAARDVLQRMAADPAVRAVGAAATHYELPASPTAGVVCPCSRITVDDLAGVWDRGFRDLELVKRAALVGTGTCQGGACLPHVRAFVAARTGEVPAPFTARPAVRQITMGEAAAGVHPDPFKRTPLHDEHLRLGASMDRFGGWWRPWNYGDHVEEYWAVREAVSLGDVSTLGKMIVAGPDSVELLERLYPTTVADIAVGRSRYVLLLNERGHLIDDGMIVREALDRFVLSFTSGGAGNAEMWVRDWAETWGLDVRIMDRTMSLAAINVTGPLAGALLRRAGLDEPPRFLHHRHADVAGTPCHVMRLSFTGEASWELHLARDRAVGVWRSLMDLGRDMGIRPHGLQALFGLRLEKGHVIVGMDTELDTTPRRISHDWAVKMDKPFFIGRDALARAASLPDHRKLFAFTMPSPAPAEGTPIVVGGEVAGHVTSSFTSPLLGHAVMLGWMKRAWSPDATPASVLIGGHLAALAHAPFYDPEGRRARA